MPHPQFTLRALLEAFLWGKNGPPAGWDSRFLLFALLYVAVVAAVLSATQDKSEIQLKVWTYSGAAFGWVLYRRKAKAKRLPNP